MKLITRRKSTKRLSFKNPLLNDRVRIAHESMVIEIGKDLCELEGREFIMNKNNSNVFQFLLFYFNEDKRALDIFPNTSLYKNIMLIGKLGCGKTLMMQMFSEYLKITGNPHYFRNVSVTQMSNHYKLKSNIDAYTYNEIDSNTYEGKPSNLCMNDIGLDSNQKSYGTDIDTLIDEFLFARYEIYQNKRNRTHLTSNLDTKDFKKKYEARLVDRFKSYNVISLDGGSLR